jgi:hypothetical protein
MMHRSTTVLGVASILHTSTCCRPEVDAETHDETHYETHILQYTLTEPVRLPTVYTQPGYVSMRQPT